VIRRCVIIGSPIGLERRGKTEEEEEVVREIHQGRDQEGQKRERERDVLHAI
jgi:hypothetical protein